MATESLTSKRILALDVLRGITIAGMLLVNNPGSWETVYAPLLHADWNGLAPTDLVFPFFMFMMGISTYISLRKYRFEMSGDALRKIIRRTLIIFLLGLFIDWFNRFFHFLVAAPEEASLVERLTGTMLAFDTLRIMGVLQRLALCYCTVSLLALTVKHRCLPWIIAVLLTGYTVLLAFGNGFAMDETNILSRFDMTIISAPHLYLYEGGIDPEGLLSTIPSIAHTLIGFLVGRMILKENGNSDNRQERLNNQFTSLLLLGVVLTFSGLLLSYGCPINKKVWSPTFVLTTCGLVSSLLGLLIWVIDVKGKRSWCPFFETFGVNPLFLYVFGSMLATIFRNPLFIWQGLPMGVTPWLQQVILTPLLGSYCGSLVYALLFITFCWVAGYWLYRHKIYFKI